MANQIAATVMATAMATAMVVKAAEAFLVREVVQLDLGREAEVPNRSRRMSPAQPEMKCWAGCHHATTCRCWRCKTMLDARSCSLAVDTIHCCTPGLLQVSTPRTKTLPSPQN